MNVKLLLVHTRWMCFELIRQPAYVVSTIAFPVLFYTIFAVPESNDVGASNLLMASFSSFAVFGVVFLQFGVGTAQERSQSWYLFLKSLPLPGSHLLMARLLSAILFSLLAMLGVVAMALWQTPVDLTERQWILFVFWLMMGGLSFSILGIAVGLWAPEKAALPIGNLIYLPLSFAGGLWKPPEILPSSIQDVSTYLPTRHYGELVWSAIRDESFPQKSLYGLLLWTIVFSVVAYWGFKKETKRG